MRMLWETTIPPSEMTATSLGAAADVHDHVPGRLGDGEAGADRCRHRLLDEIRLPRARRERRLLDRALLDARHTRGHTDDDAWVREAMLVHLLDEVTEHLLGDVEVRDDAVLERANRGDRARRATEHPLRLDPDGVHLARALVDRDDGRLGEHDPAPAHVDERVRGAEVDGHVATAEAGQGLEERHEGARVYLRVFQQLRRMPFEERHEQRARQPDDVEVVALDALDEAAAEALDRVRPRAALPLAAREVRVDDAPAERSGR